MSNHIFDFSKIEEKGFDKDALEIVKSFYSNFCFTQNYPNEGHLWFACHAAFPPSVNIDVLYRILALFQWSESSSEKTNIKEYLNFKYEMVSDILFVSSFFHKVGNDLFEIDLKIKEILLFILKNNPLLGEKRLNSLADFLIAYTQKYISTINSPRVAKGYYWTAMAYKSPENASQNFAQKLVEGNKEDIRFLNFIIKSVRSAFYDDKLENFASGRMAEMTNDFSKAYDIYHSISTDQSTPTIIDSHLLNFFDLHGSKDPEFTERDSSPGIEIKISQSIQLQQALEDTFGIPFNQLPSVGALRKTRTRNSFCCNAVGDIIGIRLSKSSLKAITITEICKDLLYLDLRDNKELRTIDFETSLPSLQYLNLKNCSLEGFKLPEDLIRLEFLNLSNNQISKFSLQSVFPRLKHLNLTDNKLQQCPVKWKDRLPNLEKLYLRNNPLPAAIKIATERQSNCLGFMLNFWNELAKGTSRDIESKVIVIGNYGVGKTSLISRIIHDNFEKNWQSTHGISLDQYNSSDFPYTLNFWDFGGQELYTYTHRLFFQSNAIYLVLWDSQTENTEYQVIDRNSNETIYNFSLAYWLHYIQTLSPNCSVIVVQTKNDLSGKEHPQKERLKSTFNKAFLSLDFTQVNVVQNDWQLNGLNKLMFLIKEAIKKMRVDVELPNNWIQLRQHLRDLQKRGVKSISLQDYNELAITYAIESPIEVLENWLVSSGVVLYLSKYFNDKIILNQEWVIETIYSIFHRNSSAYHKIKQNNGEFTGEDLQSFWPDFSDSERKLFLDFMLSSELCFEIIEIEEKDSSTFLDRKFFAPQFLPEISNGALKDWIKEKVPIVHISYRHQFFHYAIIQSLIFRLLASYPSKNVWRNAILIEKEGTDILLKGTQNGISIEIPETGLNHLVSLDNLIFDLSSGGQIKRYVSLNGKDYIAESELRKIDQSNYVEAENGEIISSKSLMVFRESEVLIPKSLSRQVSEKKLKISNEGMHLNPKEFKIKESPIKILFVQNFNEGEEIEFEKEFTFIQKKLVGGIQRNDYDLQVVKSVEFYDIIDSIQDTSPDIVHFSRYEAMNTNGLVFMDEHNKKQVIKVSLLERVFNQLKNVNPNLKLVFLNFSSSEQLARAISRSGVYTIGFSNMASSRSLRLLAAGFYRRLSEANDLILSINGGITRAIYEDPDIQKSVKIFANGEIIFPNLKNSIEQKNAFIETVTKNLQIEMIKVEGGAFLMGDDEEDQESPIHEVQLLDFYIGKYPIIQNVWESIMGDNPSHFKGDSHPVENVSWAEIQEFIQRLNEITGRNYRLPTESEWEYAAKGGPYSQGYLFAGGDNLKNVGWYLDNSGKSSHPVGLLLPNELGLYDMCGNVEEWCEDDWHHNYEGAPVDGSAWINNPRSNDRVVRGGGWISPSEGCRITDRYFNPKDAKFFNIGFRLVLSNN